MSLSGRMALDVPDCLHVIEEAEGAQDPFFGLMELNQLPSPHKIHLVHVHTLVQPRTVFVSGRITVVMHKITCSQIKGAGWMDVMNN